MLQAKAIKCGKDCKKCPHGYYIYAFWREGKKVKSKYIGKAGEIKTLQKIEKLAKEYPMVKEEYTKILGKLTQKVDQDNFEYPTTL